MISPDEFWWKNVTGPRTFLRRAAETLADGRIPILELPLELPWRHSMRAAALECLQDLVLDEPHFEIYDAADECGDQDIGEFLLERLASRDLASGYRAMSGLSVQQYLERHGILEGWILWIKGIPEKDFERWRSFCLGFGSPSLQNGTFVLEHRGPLTKALPAQAERLSLAEHVSRYDVLLFNSYVLSSQEPPLPRLWQTYAAAASSRLCGLDAELSERLLQSPDWRTKDPRELLCEEIAIREEMLSSGGDGAPRQGREPDSAALARELWSAQVEVLFPLIEMQRQRIIEAIHDRLAAAMSNDPRGQFEDRSPEDLEFGHMIYLMTAITGWERLLYVPDEKMRDSIHILRDCRNLLAHRQCCSPDQADFVLSLEY